jgi:tartrate dehydratase alpha subunit/fumarate hydratase class I-like protein
MNVISQLFGSPIREERRLQIENYCKDAITQLKLYLSTPNLKALQKIVKEAQAELSASQFEEFRTEFKACATEQFIHCEYTILNVLILDTENNA